MLAILNFGCTKLKHCSKRTKLIFQTSAIQLKTTDPEEDIIKDLNIYIFNHNNVLENNIYIEGNVLEKEIDLLMNNEYSIYVCANFGYERKMKDIDELLSSKYYLSYPDEYFMGVPMAGRIENFSFKGERSIVIELERLMSKISIYMDRSKLDDGVDMYVTSAQIKACPRVVSIFKESHVNSALETFPSGFYKSGSEVESLNYTEKDKKSGMINLYTLENAQGNQLVDNTDYNTKKFPYNDSREKICTHVELIIDYLKPEDEKTTKTGRLTYRVYPGESPSDFSIKRNHHYTICISPNGDGLTPNSWLITYENT